MPRPVSARTRYVPALDGIRAIAVVAVIVYHLHLPHCSGGLLGVAVFFTLSGYLITGLLLDERDREGRIDFGGFWMRRMRRLMPALVAVVLVVLTVTAVARPDDLGTRAAEGGTALVYVNNWWVILRGTSYFDLFAGPGPLDHLWSLSIEEQFYLVWPLLLIGMLWLFRGRRLPLIAVAALLAIGSFVLLWVLAVPGFDVTRAYEGTDTRIGGILLGAIAALLTRNRRPGHRLAAGAAGAVGLAGVFAVLVFSTDKGMGVFHWAILAVSAATALLAVGVAGEATLVGRLLGLAPLRWLGERSYGLYLWHMPAVAFLPSRGMSELKWSLLVVAVTVGLAELSWVVLEDPIRRHGLLATLRRGNDDGPAAREAVVSPTVEPADDSIEPSSYESAPVEPVSDESAPVEPVSDESDPVERPPFTPVVLGAIPTGTGSSAIHAEVEEPELPVAGARPRTRPRPAPKSAPTVVLPTGVRTPATGRPAETSPDRPATPAPTPAPGISSSRPAGSRTESPTPPTGPAARSRRPADGRWRPVPAVSMLLVAGVAFIAFAQPGTPPVRSSAPPSPAAAAVDPASQAPQYPAEPGIQPLATSCSGVMHLGDSTSLGLMSADYLPDPEDRVDAQYRRVGATDVRTDIAGARSSVEGFQGQPNAVESASSDIAQGFDGCWVAAIGTNDAANVEAGSQAGLRERVDRIMQTIGDKPVLWLTLKTVQPNNDYYSEEGMQRLDQEILDACTRYPNMRVYDWAAQVRDEWYTTDGIHFTSEGYKERGRRTARALATAFPADGPPAPGCVVLPR